MPWTKRISFTAWPVGQGLFTQADIWVGGRFLRVVYDCGTLNENRQVTADAFAGLKDREINLLVISHFHYDHISRIPELLRCAGGIKEVWIPYLSPKQRFLFALAAATGGILAGSDPPQVTEISDMAANGRQWFESRGCSVREVGNTEPPQADNEQHEERGPRDSEEWHGHDSARPDHVQLTPLARDSNTFKNTSRFRAFRSVLQGWDTKQRTESPVELLTWIHPMPDTNVQGLYGELTQWFTSEGLSITPDDLIPKVGGQVDPAQLLGLVRAIHNETSRSKLRTIYNRLNPGLNCGSLFLLARPTQEDRLYRLSSSVIPCPFFAHRCKINLGPSVLWTGDAPTNVLEECLGAANERLSQLLNSVLIHQFPHHGSRTSVSADWISSLGKHWSNRYPMSVISAGRSNTFGHPSPEALWRCPSTVIHEGSPPFEASFEWR